MPAPSAAGMGMGGFRRKTHFQSKKNKDFSMKKLFPRLSALVTASAALCAAEALAADVGHLAAVSNVSFTQNANQDVIVTYDLVNDGQPAFVTMDVLTNGVPLPVAAVQSLSGDVSTNLTHFIPDGTGKQIVWKARTDWKGNLTSNATVVVSAHYTNHLEGVYLRVDVTGGTTAEAWPIHFGSVDPDVSSRAFLQDEIWLKCVPAGTFLMGSPDDEPGRSIYPATDETRHAVALTRPFFIGVAPLTRKQWTNMGGTMGTDTDALLQGYETCPAGNLRYSYGSANTTRLDTMLGTLAVKTGLSGFALPTEAQWEYACRADTQGVWADGSPWDPGTTGSTPTVSENLSELGWYSDNSAVSETKVFHPVATKAPNAWGLYDFHGNVWEFVRDEYAAYPAASVTDPKNVPDEPVSSDVVIVRRGGSKDTNASACRAAVRNTGLTAYQTNEATGARLALEF